MKRKLLVILLPTILVVCAVVGIIIGVNSNPGGEVPHEHAYSDNVVSPTCTEAGYTEHKCSCGDSYRDNLSAPQHTLNYVAEKTATCAEEGNTAYYECSVCHKYFSDENGETEITDKNSVKSDMLAHSVALVPEKTATCAEAGNTAYYECSVCHKYFSDENGETEITDKSSVVTVVSHSLILVPEKEATCAEVGHTACYACTVCQKYFSDANAENEVSVESIIIDLAPHTVALVPEKASTCTEKGSLEHYECSECHKYFSDENGETEITQESVTLNTLPHTLNHVPEKPATGLQAGHTEYYECSECGKWFSDENGQNEITDKENGTTIKAHTLTYVPEKNATCTQTGHTAYYKCNECNKYFEDQSGENEITKESVVIDTLHHTVTLVPKQEPGLTTNGNTAYYECSDCHKYFSDENGQNEVTDKTSVIIEAIHKLTLVPEKVATCTENGHNAYYTCAKCDKWFSDENAETEITDKNSVVVNAVPHTLTLIPEKAATCTETGNITYYECFECNKYFSDENGQTEIAEKQSVVISILPHTVILVSEKEATCAVKGNIAYYKCSECNKYFSDENCETEITDKNSVITTKPHNYVDGTCAFCGLRQPTEGLRYTKYNNEYAEVSGKGTTTDKNIVIAEEYEGLPVTGIGEGAFSNFKGLTGVTIPDSVTSIGDVAFYNCSSLTSIAIPDSVTSIGRRAFYNCSGLTSVTIGNSVASIDEEAFYGCIGLASVTIPNRVAIIGENAFQGCTGLTGVYYTGTVDQWVQIDFSNYSSNPLSYGKTLYINNQVLTEANVTTATKIEDCVFYNCSGLTRITIPDSVTSIGGSAFYGCTGLTSVTIPDSVTSIGRTAFYGCTGLTSITCPSIAISTIDKTNLRTVVITSGVSIGYQSFKGCTKLASVTIGNGVTSIGEQAFYNCSGLTSVTIGNGVTSIGSSAFYNCSGLTSITIPDSVTSIGSSAFYNCSGLTSITIPDSVTSIGSSAFYNCTELTSVTIGNGVTSIADYAFSSCSGLTSITIPDSITSIGKTAFYGCTGLTSITIGNGVTSIGYDAFNGCSRLTNVYFAGTVDQWVQIDFAFSLYDNYSNPLYYAKNLYINDQLLTEANITTATEIKRYAFYCYTGLTSVTIGNSVTNIAEEAFKGCNKLKSITLPFVGANKEATGYEAVLGYIFGYTEAGNSNEITDTTYQYFQITSIGNGYKRAYYHYYIPNSLRSVTVTGGNISEHAFYNCSMLTNIIITEGVTGIGDSAFYDCNYLRSVTIGNNVTSIGDYAFQNCNRLTSVYYKGTSEQWNAITVGSDNSYLTNATRCYYSETEPAVNSDGTAYDGNYWHYDADGKVVVWKKQ